MRCVLLFNFNSLHKCLEGERGDPGKFSSSFLNQMKCIEN
jgi:hypothetical protein